MSNTKPQSTLDSMYQSSIDQFINWKKHLIDWAWALAIALVIREIIITIYMIPTGSMIPTFKVGDVLMANRFYYGLKLPFSSGKEGGRLPAIKEPSKGDVLIFRAPTEEPFYEIQLRPKNEMGLTFLKDLNQASAFKRPIAVNEGVTNYIFREQSDSLLSINRIYLHHSVYKKFKAQIHDSQNIQLDVLNGPFNMHMTYKENRPTSIVRQIFDIPFKGSTIIGTVCLNSPFMFPYQKLLIAIANKKGWNIVKKNAISFYPNPWVDMTKDYVKRIIGMPGDTIEIKNKVIYINGVRAEISGEPEIEERNGVVSAMIYQESLPLPDGTFKKHPVRFVNNNYTLPYVPFDPNLWPLDPDMNVSWMFRDNFGPFVVPEKHYFVMGDNRDESYDARFWGCVPFWAVKGTPMFKFLPISRAGIVR